MRGSGGFLILGACDVVGLRRRFKFFIGDCDRGGEVKGRRATDSIPMKLRDCPLSLQVAVRSSAA